MKRAITGLLVAVGLVLLATPAVAGEIIGHVFDDSFTDGTPGLYDPGVDGGRQDPVLLTQIGFIGGPPGDPSVPIAQWFAMPDGDGFYSFSGLPDDGIFQVDLPFLPPIVGFGANIIATDAAGMKSIDEPVPAPPLGIVAMPPTPTEVDIPILGAVAPAFTWAAPVPEFVVGGIFVDRNPGGTTGGCGLSGRDSGCTDGNQQIFGTPADGIEVVLQCLDASGVPTGAPITTLVGSTYTFVPVGDTVSSDYQFDGLFMFLSKALADGETVQVSIDPTQPALAGLLPVSDTLVMRTRDTSEVANASPPPATRPPRPDEELPVIEFRFQPVFDLGGRVKIVDTTGTERGVPGATMTLIDLLDGSTVDTTTTDANGDYLFEDLFNSVYLVRLENTGSVPDPSGVRQIENFDPPDLDFCFDQSNCPDVIDPVLTLPDDIVEECGSTSGNVISWEATATDNITPDDAILIAYAPFQPGATIPAGVHTINVTATDWCGNTATGSFTITVRDTTPPDIECALRRALLWPPRHGMLNVGFAASAEDVCDGPVDVVVTVFCNEAEGGPPFSPDADGASAEALRLRAERSLPGDGRVYLLRITSTDRAGNTAVACKSVIVPRAPAGRFILTARAMGSGGELACAQVDPFVGIPQGFVEILRIGDDPPAPN